MKALIHKQSCLAALTSCLIPLFIYPRRILLPILLTEFWSCIKTSLRITKCPFLASYLSFCSYRSRSSGTPDCDSYRRIVIHIIMLFGTLNNSGTIPGFTQRSELNGDNLQIRFRSYFKDNRFEDFTRLVNCSTILFHHLRVFHYFQNSWFYWCTLADCSFATPKSLSGFEHWSFFVLSVFIKDLALLLRNFAAAAEGMTCSILLMCA